MRTENFGMKILVIGLLLLVAAPSSRAAGKQLTGEHTPTATPALSPAEAQKKFVVPEGFEVRLFAAEPDVINPVAMTWDERGRLWVLELYEYPVGAPVGSKPRDRIKILEDTDNDGRADKITVFADGLNLATGILLGNGGVYVGQAPDLLFLQDTNHDDKADTRQVLLSGFGLEDRHELLNGFTWGPDGWLYMTHGVFTHSRVKIPEASEPGVGVTAAVARYHPRTKKFEVFAEGTSNPWGVDFDRYGNAFVSACVIDHLFHMAPGGSYQRQAGTPANPYAYEILPSIVDHKHHMAAYCGICVYQGDQFPEEYRGHVFMGNIHQNAINHDKLTPNGSSFKATAEKDFLTTSDGWFRPISEQVGPDGALWIGDWCDKYPCYQNAEADPEGVDRERGRIWRVVYVGKEAGKKMPSRPEQKMDLAKNDDAELLKLLEHSNVWQRRMAQRILTENLYAQWGQSNYWPKIFVDLTKLDQTGKSLETRLAAYWTLRSVTTACLSHDNLILRATSEENAALRGWAARLGCATYVTTNGIHYFERQLENLETLASAPEPSVRLAVATAARQLASSSLTVDTDINTDAPIGKILAALIKSSADAKDPLLAYMIWLAGEPALAKNPEGSLKWLAENGADTMPLSGILAGKAMRRICDLGEPRHLDLAVEFLSAVYEKSAALAIATLDGLLIGQQGNAIAPTVDPAPLLGRLRSSGNAALAERAQRLGALWGNAAAIQQTFALVNDTKTSLEERTKAVQTLAKLKTPAAREAVLKLVVSENPEALVIEALHALSEIGGDMVGEDIIQRWKSFTPGERWVAGETLTSRSRWAANLLSAVERKMVSASELSATTIRALSSFVSPDDEGLRRRFEQSIGRIRPANADKQKIIAAKKEMIVKAGPPDLAAGHEVAKKICLVCHKLNGEGAEVGPDLTGSGRASLDALLANLIDPNLVIGKGYENVTIETKDGRSVSGRLVESTDTRVRLLATGPKEEIVARNNIATMRVSELSVMPEGLEQMPDADFRNLIGYILNPPEATVAKPR